LLAEKQHRLHLAVIRLDARHPGLLLQQAWSRVQGLEANLTQKMNGKLIQLKQHFMQQLVTLHAVSPLATLDRGYAIATYRKKVLVDSQQVKEGDVIDVRLAKGRLVCEIHHAG